MKHIKYTGAKKDEGPERHPQERWLKFSYKNSNIKEGRMEVDFRFDMVQSLIKKQKHIKFKLCNNTLKNPLKYIFLYNS